MAKKKGKQQTDEQARTAPGIQSVNLAGDAATILGTAIGVVSGAASFVGSKVAEAVTGTPAKKTVKRGGAKKATNQAAAEKSATKKSAARKSAAKKAGGSKKQSNKAAAKKAGTRKTSQKGGGAK